MKFIGASIFALILFFQPAFAAQFSKHDFLNQAALKVGTPLNSLAIVEFKRELLVLTYFSDEKNRVQTLSFDLGLNRINNYVISEIKRKDPAITDSPIPLSLGHVTAMTQFITMQLANLLPQELREDLYQGRSELMILDLELSTYLKPFVARAYSSLLNYEIPVNSINSLSNLDEDKLLETGLLNPKYDLTKIILAYAFTNNLSIYIAHLANRSEITQ